MFGVFHNTTENEKRFEEWKPKIQAYRDALNSGIKDEYKLPDELIPSNLDSGIDVTEIPTKFLNAAELEITELSGCDLANRIAKGELSSVEVFKAFAKRATIAHQLTNCAMELFLDEGLKRAQELDEYYAKTGKTVGMLHGIPMSVKEHYNFKGKVTHSCYVAYLDNVTDNWSTTLHAFLKQGAVFYVRTTQPQSLMHLCSRNNITGVCRNPLNTSLTPGGSSSGEGAIAAMKGSVFGVGSDIGGSIRCPAAFCGVWGLRPSQKRVSIKNIGPEGLVVQESVIPVLGPLARSAQDINLFMKAYTAAKPWEEDACIIPIPWREVAKPELKSLKIAIIYDDGVVKPTPPIIRGLKVAEEKLRAAGIEVVKWEPIHVKKLIESCYTLYTSDGNQAQKHKYSLSGEPLAPLTKAFLSFGCSDAGITVAENQQLNGFRDVCRQEYLDVMNSQGIDYILGPAYVSVATKPDLIKYWGYTNLFNILDYPNVVFPTGLKVDVKLDAVDNSHKPRNDIERYEYSLYNDAKEFAGAPIGLQLTGRRYFDEELVKASEVVAEIVQA